MWESKLSFIWDKIRTAVWETVPQIALRNCYEDVVEEDQYIWFWWRGVQCNQTLTLQEVFFTRSWCHHEGIWCFSRYEEMQGLGSWNQFLKISNYLKTCSTSFTGAQSTSLSTLNSLYEAWKVSSFSNTGTWQTPLLFSCWQMFLASANL